MIRISTDGSHCRSRRLPIWLAFTATLLSLAAFPSTAAADRRSQRIAETAALSHAEIVAGRLASAEKLVRALRDMAADGFGGPLGRARAELAEGELLYYRAFLAGAPYDDAILKVRVAVNLASEASTEAADTTLAADARDLLALALYARDFRASAHAEARELLAQALAARRRSDNPCGVAESLFHLGLTFENRDHPTSIDIERARELYRDSLVTANTSSCSYEASYAERHLAGLAQDAGDLVAARAGFERSLALRRAAGATLVVPSALNALAEVLALQGETEPARELYLEAREIARKIGSASFAKAAEAGLAALDPSPVMPAARLEADARLTLRGGFFALSVSQLERSTTWYAELLGLGVELASDPADSTRKAVLLAREGAHIELMEIPAAESRGSAAGPAEIHLTHGIFKIGFEVADLDAIYARAKAEEREIFFPLVTPPGSRLRTFALLDPDGNIVQFFGK